MRYASLTALLLSVPMSAAAAGGGEGGYSFAASLAQMLGSLAVVLGLIYLVTHLSRRWLKGGLGHMGHQNYIRVVETRHMAPKKSLLLVEVAGEYLLLSNSSEGISLIKQIDMLEEIDVLDVHGFKGHSLTGHFQEKLEGFMAKLQPPRLMTSEQRGGQ